MLENYSNERKAYPGTRADFTGLMWLTASCSAAGMDHTLLAQRAPGIYALKGH